MRVKDNSPLSALIKAMMLNQFCVHQELLGPVLHNPPPTLTKQPRSLLTHLRQSRQQSLFCYQLQTNILTQIRVVAA
jgi:hypothetical protein